MTHGGTSYVSGGTVNSGDQGGFNLAQGIAEVATAALGTTIGLGAFYATSLEGAAPEVVEPVLEGIAQIDSFLAEAVTEGIVSSAEAESVAGIAETVVELVELLALVI